MNRARSAPPVVRDWYKRVLDDFRELMTHWQREALRVRRPVLPGPGRARTPGIPSSSRKLMPPPATSRWTSDPEAIHDLRVATRRLRAAITLWKPVLDDDARRKLVRELRRIRRGFGALRETEVHVAALERRVRNLRPPVAAAVRRVIQCLRARYDRKRREPVERLTPKHLRRMVRSLERAVEPLSGPPDPVQRKLDGVRRGLAHERERALARIEATATTDPAAGMKRFHRARIAIKKWRYVEERWQPIAGSKSTVLPRLRRLQELLGDAHDRETLLEELHDAAKRWPATAKALRPLLRDLEREMRAELVEFGGRAQLLLQSHPSPRMG